MAQTGGDINFATLPIFSDGELCRLIKLGWRKVSGIEEVPDDLEPSIRWRWFWRYTLWWRSRCEQFFDECADVVVIGYTGLCSSRVVHRDLYVPKIARYLQKKLDDEAAAEAVAARKLDKYR